MSTSARRQPTRSFRHSQLIVALACALGTQGALGATFTVTSAADSGTGSLREAIGLANASCATGNVIDFAAGPFTVAVPGPIALLSELPALTCATLEIRGEGRVSIVPNGSYVSYGSCVIDSQPAATGLPKLTGLRVSGFDGHTAICGTVEAISNKVHNNNTGFGVKDSVLTDNDVYQNYGGIGAFEGSMMTLTG